MKRIFVVAGEASADICGAQLIGEIRRRGEKCEFVGVGGGRMASAGMDIRFNASEFGLVGMGEWLGRAHTVISRYRRLVKMIQNERWDGALLLDLPDMNIRLARHLKRKNIPVCYYVSPQLWAWRPGRIKQIKKFVDRMLVLFPFEESYYKERAVDAFFVGHPLVEMIQERSEPDRLNRPKRFGILPGSRWSEIRYHVPILAGAIQRLRSRFPESEYWVPVPATLKSADVQSLFSKNGVSGLNFVTDSHSVLRRCDVALVASGTATLEATLMGTPFCLFYKVGPTSKLIYDFLVKVPFIGMPNLLCGREIVREFFQGNATSDALAQEAIELIENDHYRTEQIVGLRACRLALEQRRVGFDAASLFEDFLNEGSRLYNLGK